MNKQPLRSDVINFLLSKRNFSETTYLEIGVRDPKDNFNKIKAAVKYSVDPGIEFKKNPVSFPFTSDSFFEKLSKNEILDENIKFDIIFVDGLHLAEQVEKDIQNSLKFIKDDGFVVLHDCNPPTEYNAREDYYSRIHKIMGYWNGTTWKAFFKYRKEKSLHSCCVDTDWGIGILSKGSAIGTPAITDNPFYEYNVLDATRKDSLNLVSFEDFKEMINNI
ncbi:class I SAM-dependent methyltransferase [Flavobacterium qiangtangense]|uniref:Class I SAM-dependent methyltransferase n=1 Tax=Flavobacterium qiangtangense TaxID=1442595 RepID=A0ABW1PT99_9FLAO